MEAREWLAMLGKTVWSHRHEASRKTIRKVRFSSVLVLVLTLGMNHLLTL